MTTTLMNTLQQNQHDALVGLYLNEVIGRIPELKDKVTDTNSLYEYLLIDPAVERKVTTTRVGEAIASLQQYIGRICNRLEPDVTATPDVVEEWQQWRHRYGLWAGLRQLESHPENYLNPLLRQHQTPQFADLQQEIQQGKLSDSTLQKAVLNYLKNFETISTLKVLSAFQYVENDKTQCFYFIGRTRTQPTEYYIRSLNLEEMQGEEDKPSLNAWSHWEKIDIAFGKAGDTAIRPLYYQGRLYIAWFETHETRFNDTSGNEIVRHDTQLKMAQKMLDGSWRVCVEQEYKNYLATFMAAGGHGNNKHLLLSLVTDKKDFHTIKGIRLDDQMNVLDGEYNAHEIHVSRYIKNNGPNNTEVFYPFMVQWNEKNSDALEDSCHLIYQDEKKYTQGGNGKSIRYMQMAEMKNAAGEITEHKRQYVLTTNLARTMIPYAQQGLEYLFSWTVQTLEEPPLYGPEDNKDPNTQPQPIDFYGAYGQHFWELFLHLPWLVANTYAEQQYFVEAQVWHNRLFTPQKKEGRYFQIKPLHEVGQDSARGRMPEDADAMAVAHPLYFCKAVFANYIRYLLERGDACYRELTRDGFNEAKQYYIQAINLLGGEPERATAQRWVAITLDELAQKPSVTLRAWEQALADTPAPALQQKDSAPSQQDTPFRIPMDAARSDLWQSLQTRLYNLRHFLTLDGKPLSLPLYDAPVNPAELQRRLATGQSLQSAAGQQRMVVPPFRYPVMYEHANRAVDTLIQLGNSLLNALERKDGLTLEQLQLNQQQILLTYTLDMHQQAIDMGTHSLAGLEKSKALAKTRYDHYKGLYNEGFIAAEVADVSLRTIAGVISSGSGLAFSAGSIVSVAPNIAGMAFGAPGASTLLFGIGYAGQAYANAINTAAETCRTFAANERSKQEWQLQYKLAEKEQEQIECQIEAQKKQNEQYRKQKEQTLKQNEQIKKLLDFWSNRVTSAQLYQWLIGQLRTLYRAAWDATSSLCMATEAAWRCETGWFNELSPLQSISGWQESRYGLLSGESLKNALQKMQLKYLTRFERHQEVVHTLSLKALLGEAAWLEAMKVDNRKDNLDIEFSLNEKMFAERYPNFYQRRVATISLTLPAVIGPYQNVCAQLTQTSSRILQDANVEAFKKLTKGEDHQAIFSNVRASQQATLSTGFDDSGLFVLNMADERYLPFEGNGVHSNWVLRFPNVQREAQKHLLENLTDVIVTVRYRALDGGEAFANQVLQALQPETGVEEEKRAQP